MLGRVTTLLIVSIALSGCRSGALDDFIVPTSHPANPDAVAAMPLRVSRVLEPEFENVRPKLERKSSAPRPTAPASSDAAHQQHKP